MQIERIYKPDIKYQIHAIMLLLHIRPRLECAIPIHKETGMTQRSAHSEHKETELALDFLREQVERGK
jgi:hypothetical protein